MALKFKLLAITLLLRLIAFSQTDIKHSTNNLSISDSSKCATIIPCTTARKIVVDILKGDSAIAELKLTQTLLEQVKEQSAAKDITYNALDRKYNLCNQALKTSMDVNDRSKNIITSLEKDNTKLGITVKRLKRVSGLLILVAGGILLVK